MCHVQDLIAGGTESSAVTVEWAISELLKKPEIVAKAGGAGPRHRPRALEGGWTRCFGPPRWSGRFSPSLPYIDAIFKETMQLHPVAPMLVQRLSREDTTVARYDIPTEMRVLVSVTSIGRDSELWEAPE
ncbi:hypothetical protein U9M48_014523 [Paspalum notatum var. saurae]|uniref:Cytochrome P450 n=1 Tax=Paspalum notatum var. saurae TaxID=547442 RepID=A0AAQ3T1W7_PASNO